MQAPRRNGAGPNEGGRRISGAGGAAAASRHYLVENIELFVFSIS